MLGCTEGKPSYPPVMTVNQSAAPGTMYNLPDPQSESLFTELEAQLDEAGMFECGSIVDEGGGRI